MQSGRKKTIEPGDLLGKWRNMDVRRSWPLAPVTIQNAFGTRGGREAFGETAFHRQPEADKSGGLVSLRKCPLTTTLS